MFGLNKKPRMVKCEECKHYFDAVDAQIVVKKLGYISNLSSKTLYCPAHKKPYDTVIILDYNDKMFIKHVSEKVEVKEDGSAVYPNWHAKLIPVTKEQPHDTTA